MIALGIILLVLAVGLFVAELLLPTSGILGVLAALCAIGAILAFFKASWWIGTLAMLFLLVATPVALYYAVKIYPRTPIGKRVILAEPDANALSPFSHEAEQLKTLEGRSGVAMTMLRPAGSIAIDGKRIDAVSDNEVIEPGRKIEVVRVVGLKVIVRSLPS